MNIRIAALGVGGLLLLAGGAGWALLAGAGGVGSTDAEVPAIGPAAESAPLPVPPAPPRLAEGARYESCLALLDDDPRGALALAEGWTDGPANDRDGAAHCRALAEVALGNVAAGAGLLDAAAAASAAPPPARAAVFGQAAQAWLMAGDAAHAAASASQGIALAAGDADLLIARAMAETALARFAAAIADLTDALAIDARRPDALVLRATAARQLGETKAAEADVNRALALDPEDAEALLERGILRQRRADAAGARDDWERAAALAPDSSTEDLAEQNLALLQAGPTGR